MYYMSMAIAGTLLVALTFAQVQCSKGSAPGPITSVTVDWQHDFGGGGPQSINRKFTTSQPAQVQKLAAFFPEMDRPTASGRSAAWVAAATLAFNYADGSVLKVFTDFRQWNTDTRRDRDVNGDLRSYLLKVMPPSGPGAPSDGK